MWLTAFVFSGKTGIRTLGTRKGTTVFETVPIDRSGIFPWSFASANLRPFFELCKFSPKFLKLFFGLSSNLCAQICAQA